MPEQISSISLWYADLLSYISDITNVEVRNKGTFILLQLNHNLITDLLLNWLFINIHRTKQISENIIKHGKFGSCDLKGLCSDSLIFT